jgi:hypothetical protein
MLGTDISLLLIMLAGLLRLRKRGGSKFELGRLLWKQVRTMTFLSAVTSFINLIFTPEGLIYLVVATTAEVVPVVRRANFLYSLLFSLTIFIFQVFLSLDLNGSFLFLLPT